MSERLTGYGKNRTDFYGLAKLLKVRKAWHMGKMHAEPVQDASHLTGGDMPHPYRDEFFKQQYDIDYVVFSYSTPIAWHTRQGTWTVPDVKYSQTTTTHQGKITVALSVIDKV